MSEKKKISTDSILGGAVGIVLTAMLFAYGPIDKVRVLYNTISGDTRIMKQYLLDYGREQLTKELKCVNFEISESEIEAKLAKELKVNGYKFDQGEINPEDVSHWRLWDLVEDYPKDWVDQWLWP